MYKLSYALLYYSLQDRVLLLHYCTRWCLFHLPTQKLSLMKVSHPSHVTMVTVEGLLPSPFPSHLPSSSILSYVNLYATSFPGRVQFRHLKLIQWRDERGETQKFNLMERISFKWRDIGELLLSFQHLDCIAGEHCDKHIDCCQTVLHHWLENPPEEYPITWRGLIELLQDSELGQVVAELKNALSKSNVK